MHLILSSLQIRAKEYFTNAHDETNHTYVDEKSYAETHLQHTATITQRFAQIVGLTIEETELAISAAWGHDAVSDARVTHNDILKTLQSATLAKLCCNLCEDVHGTTRDERNSPAYYERLRSHKLSVFVKICDRIANVEQGTWEGTSSMPKRYAKEFPEFYNELCTKVDYPEFELLWEYLVKLFENLQSTDKISKDLLTNIHKVTDNS